MSNELTVFENEQFGEVRALLIEGEPWFVAKDVAAALGYADTGQAIRKNCRKAENFNDYRGVSRTPPKIIPESDVYRLIMRSRLPQAEQYQDWVVEEVLPSIRRMGSYSMAQVGDGVSREMAQLVAQEDAVMDLLERQRKRGLVDDDFVREQTERSLETVRGTVTVPDVVAPALDVDVTPALSPPKERLYLASEIAVMVGVSKQEINPVFEEVCCG